MNAAEITLELGLPGTWPAELGTFLNEQHDLFLKWEVGANEITGPDYDAASSALQDLLNRYHLVGWHCTRLTQEEVAVIRHSGMDLPNRAMLNRRLDILANTATLSETIVEKLKATNQADDDNRAGMVWFCFSLPRLAGERGIERFFRHWGGEALYNSHENDPETGTAISRIGQPYLIEAVVPFSGMRSTRAAYNVARRYLIFRGYQTEEPITFEAPIKQVIPPSAISQIIPFPSESFLNLTGCATWEKPL